MALRDRSRVAALLQPIGDVHDCKHSRWDGQDQRREGDGVDDLAVCIGYVGQFLMTRLVALDLVR